MIFKKISFGSFAFKITAVGLIALAAGMVMVGHKAYAGSCGPYGIGYFSGKDYSCIVYSQGGDDVDQGRFSGADTSKPTFIADVKASRAARFYESLLGGSNWENNVNNPDISIAVRSESNRVNSLYLPTVNDYAFYVTQSPTNVSSLVFYNNKTGAVYTIIKIDCGNPLNETRLPFYRRPSPWVLSASTTESVASLYPGQSIKFTSTLYNRGGGTASGFCYGPRYFYSNTSSPVGGDGVPYAGETGVNTNPSGTCDGRMGPDSNYGPNGLTEQTVTIPASPPASYICGTFAFSPYDSSGARNGRSRAVCAKIQPVRISCGSSSLSSLSVGVPASFHVSMTYSGGAPPPGSRFTITVSGPNSSTYPNVGAVVSGGTITSSPDSVFTPATGGTYNVSWVYTYTGGGVITCPASPGGGIGAGYTPYFDVVGGDVSAGAGFGDGCSDDTTAGITAMNRGLSGGYQGAASTLGSFALSTITGFASGTFGETGGNTSNMPQPNGLMFANTTGQGNFGSLGCAPDYAGDAVSDPNTKVDDTASSVDIGTLASGTYVYNNSSPGGAYQGRFVINGGVIPADTQITIVVNTDVEITGDITYGPYSSLAHVPRVTIIANGQDIYISHNVNQLDGFYVAQAGEGNPGTIYTCTDDTGAESIDPALCSGTASNPTLVINGAVAAGAIRFDRTAYNAIFTQPAERIVFSPELWSAGLGGCASNPATCPTTDNSITELPPVL